MNAAQLLVRCLEDEGVDDVFGIPGTYRSANASVGQAGLEPVGADPSRSWTPCEELRIPERPHARGALPS
jgi:hypothetical protein